MNHFVCTDEMTTCQEPRDGNLYIHDNSQMWDDDFAANFLPPVNSGDTRTFKIAAFVSMWNGKEADKRRGYKALRLIRAYWKAVGAWKKACRTDGNVQAAYNRTCEIIHELNLTFGYEAIRRLEDTIYQDITDERRENTPSIAFGECWTGMGAHTAAMTQMERMIFEDCYDGSGGVQRQSMNVPSIGKGLKVELVARELGITDLEIVEDLMHFWGVIDDSGRLHKEFKRWTIARGAAAAHAYFHNLAAELTDDEIVNEVAFDNGSPFGQDAADGDFDQDAIVAAIESESADTAAAGAWGLELEAADGWEAAFGSPSEASELERAWARLGWTDETGKFHPDRGFAAPPVLRYVTMNQILPQPTEPHPAVGFKNGCYVGMWDRQPRMTDFDAMLAWIEVARLDEVNQVRRAVAKKETGAWMSKVQKAVFWTHIRNRKSLLDGRKSTYIRKLLAQLTGAEKSTLTKIRNAKSVKQAKLYWRWIYEALEGKRDMGRRGFVEYVLKPELDRRQRSLVAFEASMDGQPAQMDHDPLMDDEAYLASMVA